MTPKPIADRVVIKRLDEDRERIWTPDTAVRTARGIVLEKGEEVRWLELADEVLFMNEDAIEFRIADETMFLVHERRVLVVLSQVSHSV